MKKKAQSFTVNGVITVLFLAIMVFGLVSGFRNVGSANVDTMIDAFKENNNVSIPKKGFATMMFFVSQGAITPATRSDWLPPEGKHIFILEDFPIVDGTDFILIIPFVFLAIYIARMINSDSVWKNILFKVLVFLGLILIAYISWKIIMLYTYYWSAEVLGIGKELAMDLREKIIDATGRFAGIMTALTLVGGIGLFKVFKKDD